MVKISHDIIEMGKTLGMLKSEFVKMYDGNSHIQEFLPNDMTKHFPINDSHLKKLHNFARNNPIYHDVRKYDISEIPCTVYEGDINSYWLGSIKHGSSCQPFYPTWILSAYIAALCAKSLGCKCMVDVGSGDGRIAYCGDVLGMKSYSIEIDEALVELQSNIAKSTQAGFECTCADASTSKFSAKYDGVVFFIGGLPQMGGDILADAVIRNAIEYNTSDTDMIFVLAGTYSMRGMSVDIKNGGWSDIIKKHSLEVICEILLPTVWTFDQKIDTPYIFAKVP